MRRSELRATDRPLSLAYADPPYPGKSALYRGHPDYAGEVDHAELLARLATFDGWALSTSAAALPAILALAVGQDLPVRVAAWVRGSRPHTTARLLNAWEPVVFAGGRRIVAPRSIDTRRDGIAGPAGPAMPSLQVDDALVGPTPRQRPTLPTSVIGMKPPEFAEWVFRLLGALPGDSLADLFPGSGLVGRAWADYSGRPTLTAQASRVDVVQLPLEV